MEGIVTYRNVSQCWDVFDPKGDGDDRVMGVQYYIAFRHTDSRVMEQIWTQNDRQSFYEWLYGPEMVYGPVNEIVIKDGCVTVNGEVDTRRGRKLYDGDVVCYNGNEIQIKK